MLRSKSCEQESKQVAEIRVACITKRATLVPVLMAKPTHGVSSKYGVEIKHSIFTDDTRSKITGNVITTEEVVLVDILMSFHAHDHDSPIISIRCIPESKQSYRV
jgi:hypothetical protein